MSRPVRISLIAIASLVVLALIVVIGGIEVLRSDWFFQQLRQRLIAEMEKSTGGKVELREFHFDWSTLVAEADGLVIHGTEPPDEAPLLRAAKVTIGLKLISLEKQQIDVASVDIAQPQVNLLICGRRPHQYSRTQDAGVDEEHRPDHPGFGCRAIRGSERNRANQGCGYASQEVALDRAGREAEGST